MAETWTAGGHYEAYVGRWSRMAARRFVEWLAVPGGASWLDVGCGTGALMSAIAQLASPEVVVGVDPSRAFVDHGRDRLSRPGVLAVADAHALPFAEGSFDACVSGLVLNFLRDPGRALHEMRRVVRPRAVIAAYVWDYAGEMQLMRRFWDAAIEADPAAAEVDEGRRFPLANPAALAGLFTSAGLTGVETSGIDIDLRFDNFDDLWTPFLGGQGPAPGYVASLSEERRAELADLLRARLPVARDGTIDLVARAWSVRGRS